MSSKRPSLRHMLAAVGVAAVTAACGGNGVDSTTAASPTPTRSVPATGVTKTACDLATADEIKGLIGQDVTRQPASAAPSGVSADNCVYKNASGTIVVIGLNSQPGLGASLIQAALSRGARSVSGLGEQAVLSQQGGALAINALKGNVLVSLTVSGASVSEPAAEAFVRVLLTRL